ncbi:MAG: GIY-YIG nuclease family protein [Nitrosopumilaceae archaeon]|nr:GIY-YIG nuclease family protein [Nitrosopumilaceae archaeon]NIU01770.1 GIY-YIG nuclease family protein [Nitrosopumilaceae archaeon]NIU88170.1 GIY-YIG nuclease family protein [Nitrosopumilaceae archaeon]NIV66493.1 GIY-YIG nuclease family protein [Nitrosopumilaceae archaeon]NIX62372.1 GIY-YIG nuclease family protein [Nitrosopumilaceae archaeon]
MELLDGKVLIWLESAQFVKAKPGVYVLYDKDLNAIYVGESENLQSRFEKYVNTNFESNPCKQKTHTYQREFVDNPQERKEKILDDYKRDYGKAPCCNEDD